MKKIIVFFLMMYVAVAGALTLADLGYEEQLVVEDFVVSLDTEITPANFEDFEGIAYTILAKTQEYIIIEYKNWYFIVWK